MKNNVGQKIKKLRELRNYTQSYMAIELDITQQGYSKIEKEGRLTVDQLERIATILKVDSSYILRFNEENLLRDSQNAAVRAFAGNDQMMQEASDPQFYAQMIMLLRKEVDCLYQLAFPGNQSPAFSNK